MGDIKFYFKYPIVIATRNLFNKFGLSIIVLVMIFLHSNFGEMFLYLKEYQRMAQPWLVPIFFNSGYSKLLILLPLLLMLATITNFTGFDRFLVVRLGVKQWVNVHYAYLLVIPFIYFAITQLLTIFLLFENIDWYISDWNSVLISFFRNGTPVSHVIPLDFPRKFLDYYNPLLLNYFFLILLILVSMIMGGVIFNSYLALNSTKVGLIIVAVLIMIDQVIPQNIINLRLNPIAWLSIKNIKNGIHESLPGFTYIIVISLSYLIAMICLSRYSVKRRRLVFTEEEGWL